MAWSPHSECDDVSRPSRPLGRPLYRRSGNLNRSHRCHEHLGGGHRTVTCWSMPGRIRTRCTPDGPPGTGKTRGLTEAIGELLKADQRVLLVPATNIAVDNALLGVVKAHPQPDGAVLRVGAPLVVGEHRQHARAGALALAVSRARSGR